LKIAILGATGHLSKCAYWVYSKDKHNDIFLFSRSPEKLKDICLFHGGKIILKPYGEFANENYDVIFNGVGVWDTPDSKPCEIFPVTECYDNMILEYQKTHAKCVSIHVSSGAAYASGYNKAVNADTRTQLAINNFTLGNYYSIAKIHSEAKHRAFNDLNIVDIRLFGFFSRFMSLDYSYMLGGLINAVKSGKTFKVISENFWRDYIHMNDFAALLNSISTSGKLNTAIDLRSKKPISKDELIHLFANKYGLKYEVDRNVKRSRTGVKPYYYSTMENSVYSPRYTSLETVESELKYFLGGGEINDD